MGQTVTFKRIACNSIIVYFFGEPGDESVVSVFIDPSWRYQKNGKVVVGSYDLQTEESDFDSREEYEESFSRQCALTDGIHASRLISCAVDLESSDLTMGFSDGQMLRNFANSGVDDKAWTYRNLPQGLTAIVSPMGVRLWNGKR